jgi:hypothetical protein
MILADLSIKHGRFLLPLVGSISGEGFFILVSQVRRAALFATFLPNKAA